MRPWVQSPVLREGKKKKKEHRTPPDHLFIQAVHQAHMARNHPLGSYILMKGLGMTTAGIFAQREINRKWKARPRGASARQLRVTSIVNEERLVKPLITVTVSNT